MTIEDWMSGPDLWLIDVCGELRVVAEALAMLVETRFKEQLVRMVVRDAGGGVMVDTMQALIAAAARQTDRPVSSSPTLGPPPSLG